MTEPRVLLAVMVRDDSGDDPLVLESLRRIAASSRPPDLLVIDDTTKGTVDANAAPDRSPGSYRPAVHLGVPRALNVVRKVAIDGAYDHVVLANATTVLPTDFVVRLVGIAEQDAAIGSVTAWSTNAPGLALPNDDPGRFLVGGDVVGLVSEGLRDHYRDVVLDVPTSSFFATLLPVAALRRVGGFDPCLGSHVAEVTDWCLRSRALGLRVVLAPGVFAYHAGLGVQAEPAHPVAERCFVADVLAMRYPLYLDQVRAFSTDGILEEATVFGVDAIIRRIASTRGWRVQQGWDDGGEPGAPVRVVLHPDRQDAAKLVAEGFSQVLSLKGDRLEALVERLGSLPLHEDRPATGPHEVALAGAGAGGQA